MYRIALDYIQTCGRLSFNDMEESDLRLRLQTIHNVMRLVKHLFEGQFISEEGKRLIVTEAQKHENVIHAADAVLET